MQDIYEMLDELAQLAERVSHDKLRPVLADTLSYAKSCDPTDASYRPLLFATPLNRLTSTRTPADPQKCTEVRIRLESVISRYDARVRDIATASGVSTNTILNLRKGLSVSYGTLGKLEQWLDGVDQKIDAARAELPLRRHSQSNVLEHPALSGDLDTSTCSF